MTDFEKRAEKAAEEKTITGPEYQGFMRGARWANADREAYAQEKVREERERILGMLVSDECFEWYLEQDGIPFGKEYAGYLEARLKGEAGKGKQE